MGHRRAESRDVFMVKPLQTLVKIKIVLSESDFKTTL